MPQLRKVSVDLILEDLLHDAQRKTQFVFNELILLINTFNSSVSGNNHVLKLFRQFPSLLFFGIVPFSALYSPFKVNRPQVGHATQEYLQNDKLITVIF